MFTRMFTESLKDYTAGSDNTIVTGNMCKESVNNQHIILEIGLKARYILYEN